MAKQSYVAFYEDAAKVEAAAKARGFTGNDGESWHDFVEAERTKFRTSRMFSALDPAVEWLKADLSAVKSVYGQGTIILQEPVARRCSACVCGGIRGVREYTVDDDGIAADEPISSPCVED